MGTNYYLRVQEGAICPSCGRGESYTSLHIGKSSAGWAFCFNPNEGRTPYFSSWRKLLEANPSNIYTEYGKRVGLYAFYRMIADKKALERGTDPMDSEGYRISTVSDFS